MSDLFKMLRTVRHLRPAQWYWRLCYRRELSRPPVPPRAPATIVVRDDFPAVLLRPEGRIPQCDISDSELVEQLEQGRVTLLNESRDLGTDPIDWRLGTRDRDRLWTITLHYHQWAWRLAGIVVEGGGLAARADRLLRRYLGDWITRCDLAVDGSRALAWNAYAIATRLGWWCRLFHLLGPKGRASWDTLEPVFLESLWTQAAYLTRHMEKDLRANHLLRDAVGLAWAGRFFSGSTPEQWLREATKLALEQADEQVLPDGGHFERSPMYHIEVMEDFLTLAVLLEDEETRRNLKVTWRRMAEALAWMRHPDGQIALFNDGGFNGAPSPKWMLEHGPRTLGVDVEPGRRQGGRLLSDFGLAVWHGRSWSLFFDVGQVGVDYQPGHAHADTLSIEASYKGQRVIVDRGTFRYDNDELRRDDRATNCHNTIAIDEADSSEVWHIFRVGRRAMPLDVRFETRPDGVAASAGHDGYDRLPGRPRHRRSVDVGHDGRLSIVDFFEGRGRHTVSGGMLLAPQWGVEATGDGWNLQYNGMVLRVTVELPQSVQTDLVETGYHPEYGLELTTKRLCWRGELEFPNRAVIRIEPEMSTPS